MPIVCRRWGTLKRDWEEAKENNVNVWFLTDDPIHSRGQYKPIVFLETVYFKLYFSFNHTCFKIYFWTIRGTLLSWFTQEQLLKSNLGTKVTLLVANSVVVMLCFQRALWKTDSQCSKHYDGNCWLTGAEVPYRTWSSNTGMFVSYLPSITKNFLSSQFLWLWLVMSKEGKLIFSDLRYCQILTLL